MSQKPIAQLLFTCYFFPLILSLLCLALWGTEPNSALLSVVFTSFGCIILFFKIKQWEGAWHERYKALKRTPTPAPIQETSSDSAKEEAFEEALKQKEEEVANLQNEIGQQKHEQLFFLRELKEKQDAFEAELLNKNAEIQKATDELLEVKLALMTKETRIEALQAEVENLQFELKTLLKLEKKNSS